MEKPLNILKNIKKVEAPEYLLSRIQARIEKEKTPVFLLKTILQAAAISLTIICFDVYVIISENKLSEETELSTFVNETNNQLYYE